MSRLIKILHIDPNYQIIYLIYRSRSSIRTSVSLPEASTLFKKRRFAMSQYNLERIFKPGPGSGGRCQ